MSRLRLVKGNTFYTKNEIRAYRYDGTEIEDFSLTQCKNIKVIANKVHSREIINNYNILDDHTLRIQWVGSKLQLGPYRLEITGKYKEADFRYFSEEPIFDIVNSADDQEIPADSIIESDYYIIRGSKQYIDLPNVTIQGIQSDWKETNVSSPSYIKNKPNITIPTALSEFTNNVGFITRYDLPEVDLSGYVKESSLAAVATTGNYDDLSGRPTIPSLIGYATEQYVTDKIELAKITEDIVSSWGFTKNTGTYNKPSTGIPKTDLASDVQTNLDKADSAIQGIQINKVALTPDTDNTIDIAARNGSVYETLNAGTLINNTYISNTNGKEIAYNTWSSTDYISLENVLQIKASKSLPYSALYNSEKEFIQGITVNNNFTSVGDAKFIRLSGSTHDMNGVVITVKIQQEVDIWVPKNTSDLNNDSGFTTNTGTITGITMNGVSKGTSGVVDLGTVLTSFTETDPVFAASAAAGISSSDITTWNNKQNKITAAQKIGSLYRNNVSGSGNITITGTTGQFPRVTNAGTYTVIINMSSSTQNYGLTVSFGGNSYTLTAANGVIKDSRQVTVPANAAWSAAVVGSVNSNTVLSVEIWSSTEEVTTLHKVAVTGSYEDLEDKPTIDTKYVEYLQFSIDSDTSKVDFFKLNGDQLTTSEVQSILNNPNKDVKLVLEDPQYIFEREYNIPSAGGSSWYYHTFQADEYTWGRLYLNLEDDNLVYAERSTYDLPTGDTNIEMIDLT